MKKILLVLLAVAFLHTTGFTQAYSTEGRVEYQKGYKTAAVVELPYKPEVVETAVKDYMLKRGVKEQKNRGFQVFKAARLSPTDGEVADLYFKVERKSRKDANISNVYLVVGRPNENVGLRTAEDRYRLEDGRTFLNEMAPSVGAFDLEVSIKEQDQIVEKAEKKLKSLEDNEKNLEKKIRDLQEKLTENRRDQESQRAELSKQRSATDAMRARRIIGAQ